MNGPLRFNLAEWGRRQWAMTALALVAFLLVALAGTRGLASGAQGEVLRIRFGGDGERTRVVIDLNREAAGAVIEPGDSGRVVLSLRGVGAGRGLTGQGLGLVRDWRVTGGFGARVELALATGAVIERRFLLPPGDGVRHFRYVVDLKSTGQAATPQPRAPRRNQPPAERPLIVIDAGHGGHDPGASGARAREAQVTLAAARALKAELERTGRYRVRLTRDADSYIALNRRVQIARAAEADLFISLHADAHADPVTRGASVYTLSEQGAGRARRALMGQENWRRELNLPGRDASVDRILLDMTQRATQNASARLARTLLTEIEGAEHPLLRRSHRDAGFAVLLAPDVPAVLLEMGYITNAEDERLLTDERGRRRLMRAVAKGIEGFFADRAPSGGLQMAGAPGPTGGSR